MELRHLRYFVAVAEELHFGHAAQKLGIAQPPLSQQIRQLEMEIGVQLLQRTKRRVQMTEAGSAFLEGAREALRKVDHAIEIAQRAGRGEVGKIAIGFPGAATYSLLPSILIAFRRRYPDVEVKLQELKTSELIAALHGRQIQVGFVRMPLQDELLAVEPLLCEELVVALPEQHPLASRDRINFCDLAQEAFLLPPPQMAPGFHKQVHSLCRQEGFVPKLGAQASELQTIMNLVAAGVGITLVAESVRNFAGRGVIFKQLPEPAPIVEFGIASLRDEHSEILSAFLSVVRETVIK
jgi:DNA-binding transcriptional LysR family regulator